MPTQRGMSFFIEWKPETGEPMREKKDRERFSIKFNENDPAHDAVIRLLEKQGPHSKAQFIVNAVLHYINDPGVLAIPLTQTVDRASIENIVMEILCNRDSGQQDTINRADSIKVKGKKQESAEPPEQRHDTEPDQKEMDEALWTMIADTMSAFRNN